MGLLNNNANISKVNQLSSDLASNANKLGDITQLNTADKTSAVNAIKEVKGQANTNQTQIQSLASGSPAGVFATLTALQADATANTTLGKTKIYVVTADGKWYYWNVSAWTVGGTYQGIGLNNGSVTQKKLEDELKSLFIPYYSDPLAITWVDGSAIKYDGTTVVSASYKYCKYPVNGGDIFKIKTQRLWDYCGWIVLGASNNVLLTDTIVSSQVSTEQEVEIPSGGAFICFNSWSNSFSYLSKVKYNLKPSEIGYNYLPSDLKNTFEYIFNDITSGLTWVNGSYITKNGTFTTSAGHSYAVIDVTAGLECKITGAHSWAISCYVVKDNLGNVVLEDGASDGVVTSFNGATFTIPSNGAKLYINKYSFVSLLLKNKLSVKTNKSPLDNKTIIFSGTSICAAAIETSPGVYNGQYGWAEIIKENNPSCVMKNYGQGGTTIAKRTGHSDSILERLTTMYTEYPSADYIILEGGVNDCYTTSIPFGTVTSGYTATLDETTFCGAMESLCKNAILKWVGKKIGFIITFKVPTADSTNFINYMNKAKEICEKWSIPYIDLYNKSGLEFHISEMATAYSYGGGGLHPNIEGYKIITPKIESWIKTL